MSADDELAFAFFFSSQDSRPSDGSPTFVVGPLHSLTPHKHAKKSVSMVISESQSAGKQD